MTSINRSMAPADWAMLLTLSLVWGGSFFFVGVAVRALPPLTIVALRVGLAATALYIVARVSGVNLPARSRVWAAFFCMGLINNVIPFCLIVWAQTRIESGLASILNGATPLFATVAAHVLTADEKMTPPRLTGVIVGMAGVIVVIGPGALQGLGRNLPAQIAVLAAALSYSLAGVFGRRFAAMAVPPLATAAGQLTASAAVLVPLAAVVDRPWLLPAPAVGVWGAIVSLALFSTAVAYILYFRVLASAGAANVLLVTFLIPVSAILLSTLFLGEQLAPTHYTGMGVIGLGLAIIDGRLVLYLKQVLPGKRRHGSDAPLANRTHPQARSGQ